MACKIDIKNTINKSIENKVDFDFWGYSLSQAKNLTKFINDIWNTNILSYLQRDGRGSYQILKDESKIDEAVEIEYNKQLKAETKIAEIDREINERDLGIDEFGDSNPSYERVDYKNVSYQNSQFKPDNNDINTKYSIENENIKSGVEEVFNENPELANSVYEAIGFKSKLDELDLPSFGNTYNEYIPYRENKLNGRDIDRLSIIAEVLEDTTNEELYTLIKSELAKSDKYKDDSKFLSSRDFYSWLGDIKVKGIRKDIEEYKEGNRFKGKDVLKAITNTPFSEYVNMLLDLKKESKKTTKKEITPQQKQQATFMFSEFLDVYLQDLEQVERILKEEKIIDKKCS